MSKCSKNNKPVWHSVYKSYLHQSCLFSYNKSVPNYYIKLVTAKCLITAESERLRYCVENKQGSFNEDSSAVKFMDLFS